MAIEAAPYRLPQSIELSLLLTDDEGIAALNRDYRGLDKPTDVLSFPLWDAADLTRGSYPGLAAEGGGLPLGDIVISLERAAAQAEAYGHSREREAVFLWVHGLLHLLGYDHELGEEQERRMFALQDQIMVELGL